MSNEARIRLLLLVIEGVNVRFGTEVIFVLEGLSARGYDVLLRDTIASYIVSSKNLFLLLVKLYLAVVERLDDGERLYSDAAVSEILASVLECFLDDESHAL